VIGKCFRSLANLEAILDTFLNPSRAHSNQTFIIVHNTNLRFWEGKRGPPALRHLRLPPESGVAPIKILNLLLAEAGQLGIDISLVPLLVVRNHPQEEEYREKEDG
jgi:hypothetical protein